MKCFQISGERAQSSADDNQISHRLHQRAIDTKIIFPGRVAWGDTELHWNCELFEGESGFVDLKLENNQVPDCVIVTAQSVGCGGFLTE